jgi:hypothetical protein
MKEDISLEVVSCLTGKNPLMVKGVRRHICHGKFFFLRTVNRQSHIVHRPVWRDESLRKSLQDAPIKKKDFGGSRLKRRHESQVVIPAHQVVQIRRSAAPVTDDENRRLIDHGIFNISSIPDPFAQSQGNGYESMK